MHFLSNQEHGVVESSIIILLTSIIGEASPPRVKGFITEMKGNPLNDIVEQVRDGSTIRVYFIHAFHFVQVYVAGA